MAPRQPPAISPPRLNTPFEPMTEPVLPPPPRRIVDPDAVDQTSEVFEPATEAREEQGDSRPKRLAAEVDPL